MCVRPLGQLPCGKPPGKSDLTHGSHIQKCILTLPAGPERNLGCLTPASPGPSPPEHQLGFLPWLADDPEISCPVLRPGQMEVVFCRERSGVTNSTARRDKISDLADFSAVSLQ